MKFQINSVGILAPALPGLIAAFFLLRHLHAAFDQCVAQCINVLHFKAEMLYPLAANFRSRIGLENFNEMTGADLEIKSEQYAILEEVKLPVQSQCPAIKIQASIQVF